MSELKTKPSLNLVHLQTVLFLVVFFIVSNALVVNLLLNPNIYTSFFGALTFGTVFGFIFLYLFNHKDFFSFMGKFELEEKDKEKKYLDKFSKYGRLAASILVGAIAGPIFLALTVRFLFLESENRYLIVFISTLISTIFVVAFAKGVFSFF
ncbi:MAG TPA: hypothetical protein VKC53_00385 [Patescibacteria group bacterium]|nr:hypothetical protein [Patescibacteria group bacterium]